MCLLLTIFYYSTILVNALFLCRYFNSNNDANILSYELFCTIFSHGRNVKPDLLKISQMKWESEQQIIKFIYVCM